MLILAPTQYMRPYIYMGNKIKALFVFIQRNWFKLALLAVLIWFGFILKNLEMNVNVGFGHGLWPSLDRYDATFKVDIEE